MNALGVKSMTDHWSIGTMFRGSRQTFNNHRLNLRIAPGVEYNIFPYRESTNRQLTFQWTAGYNRFKYDEETLFGLLEDSRWDDLSIRLDQQQHREPTFRRRGLVNASF